MKSLKNIIQSTTAKVVTIAALALMPYFSSAQTEVINPNGVPTEQINNQFQKPDVHSQFLDKVEYEYYGSGDVDGDGVPATAQDAQAIRDGVVNDQADVNYDNEVNEADAQVIDSEHVIGVNYMSTDFTKEEREEMIYNLYNNVLIPSHPNVINANDRLIMTSRPGWVCSHYSMQAVADLKGISDLEGYLDVYMSSELREHFISDNNARFNVQANTSSSYGAPGVAHSILAFPVGDDLNQIENWYYLDAKTGNEANPGSIFNMYTPEESSILYDNAIKWIGTCESFGPWVNGQLNDYSIIKFRLNTDESVEAYDEYPDYIFIRPTVTVADNYSSKEKEKMSVYNNGETLQLKYYADANEKVKVDLIDLGTGRVVKTLESEVTQGENNLTIPGENNYSSGMKAVRVVDEDKSNVQTVKYANFIFIGKL